MFNTLDLLPNELWCKIMQYAFPCVGVSSSETRRALTARQICHHVQALIHTHIIAKVERLFPRVMKEITDNEVVLFTGVTSLSLYGPTCRVTAVVLKEMTWVTRLEMFGVYPIIAEQLHIMTQLRHLVLRKPSEAQRVGLRGLSNLQYLDLIDNETIGDEDIAQLSRLSSLFLHNRGIREQGQLYQEIKLVSY